MPNDNYGYYGFESVDAGKLTEVHRTFTGFLFDSLGQAPRWSATAGITSPLQSRGAQAKAKMATRSTGVHEWDDEREFGEVVHKDHAVEIKRWANALKLKMDDLEDDDLNLGQYRDTIADLGDDFGEQEHNLLISFLTTGDAATNGPCYDGGNFFANNHPILNNGDGVTSVSNLETGAFSETTLQTAINTMTKMRKPNGMFANVYPDTIIAPVALTSAIEKVLKAGIVDSGNGSKTNTMAGKLKNIIHDPRLDLVSTTAYYLWDSTKILKPFFLAERSPLTPQMGINDWDRLIKWGAWRRYNVGYGFYQSILKSTGA